MANLYNVHLKHWRNIYISKIFYSLENDDTFAISLSLIRTWDDRHFTSPREPIAPISIYEYSNIIEETVYLGVEQCIILITTTKRSKNLLVMLSGKLKLTSYISWMFMSSGTQNYSQFIHTQNKSLIKSTFSFNYIWNLQ